MFHGASAESTYCGLTYIGSSVAEQSGEFCATMNQCNMSNDTATLTCLRSLHESIVYTCELETAFFQNKLSSHPLKSDSASAFIVGQVLPNIDGYVLHAPPVEAIARGDGPDVPVLFGSNEWEFMLFATSRRAAHTIPFNITEVDLEYVAGGLINGLLFRELEDPIGAGLNLATPESVSKLLAAYPASDFMAYAAKIFPEVAPFCTEFDITNCVNASSIISWVRSIAMVTDFLFTSSTQMIVEAVAHRGQRSFRYLFKQNATGITGRNKAFLRACGAFHSLDVPFVFGNFDGYANGWKPTANEITLSTRMQQYWVNFAVSKTPNVLGVPTVGHGGSSLDMPWITTLDEWPQWNATNSTDALSNPSGARYMQLEVPGLSAGSGFRSANVAKWNILSRRAETLTMEMNSVSKKFSESQVVMTQYGAVRGVVNSESSTVSWLGVRFGKQPIGGLRWKPPVAPDTWAPEVKVADTPLLCYQIYNHTTGPIGSEADCLTVNIWAPANASNTSL